MAHDAITGNVIGVLITDAMLEIAGRNGPIVALDNVPYCERYFES